MLWRVARDRWRALWHRADVRDEIDEELRFHVEMRAQGFIRAGMSPVDALRAAERAFGGRVRIRERGYDVRGGGVLEAFADDLRQAIRGIRAQPRFAAAVIATLALGIGVNATMFSLVDRMLFRAPPFLADPMTAHRIYFATTVDGRDRAFSTVDYPMFMDLARRTTSFTRVAAYAERELGVVTTGAAHAARVAAVSAHFFDFFDAAPVLGRFLVPADDTLPEGTNAAVLSYAAWDTSYGHRADVLGSQLRIGLTTYTIVGVAPKGFAGVAFDQPAMAFVSIASFAVATGQGEMLGQPWWEFRGMKWLQLVARRRSGVSVAKADSDLTRAYAESRAVELSERVGGGRVAGMRPKAIVGSILTERGPIASSSGKVAALGMAMAVVVLLIACANVANLMLARALRRRREVALRIALGVGRSRLLAQLLTESVVLAVCGAIAGVALAQAGTAVMRVTFLGADSAPQPIATDPRTLLVAFTCALGTGVVAGLAPFWLAPNRDVATELRAGLRKVTIPRSRMRLGLLVGQGALAAALLVGAGLFVRSVNRLQGVRLGYDADRLLFADVHGWRMTSDAAEAIALRRRLIDAARSVPGVTSASFEETPPFLASVQERFFADDSGSIPRVNLSYLNAVSPSHFETAGTRIVRGRAFGEADSVGAPRVAIVSAAMAASLWPRKDPLGRCIRLHTATSPCAAVVGVAEDLRSRSVGATDGPYLYVPIAQRPQVIGTLLVRAGSRGEAGVAASNDRRPVPTDALVESLRARLQRELPRTTFVSVKQLSEVLGDQTRSWRLGAILFSLFGALALVLAAVGLYGVIAYDVTQRTQELGVRVALGAQPGDVARLVVVRGACVGASGIVIGCALALIAGRWVQPLLFAESARDPVVFALVAGVLLTAAVAASWIPARRVARVDPTEALRAD
jgi:putative ABC transport system permease protein